MMGKKVKVQELCLRCDHYWFPARDEKPLVCPHCKTPYWNIPRRKK